MTNYIYDDARIYDILFGEPISQKDFEFYSTLINPYGEPILELACETGRITIPLAQNNFKIHGLDNSLAMINQAKEKAKKTLVSIQWHLEDMRNFF